MFLLTLCVVMSDEKSEEDPYTNIVEGGDKHGNFVGFNYEEFEFGENSKKVVMDIEMLINTMNCCGCQQYYEGFEGKHRCQRGGG